MRRNQWGGGALVSSGRLSGVLDALTAEKATLERELARVNRTLAAFADESEMSATSAATPGATSRVTRARQNDAAQRVTSAKRSAKHVDNGGKRTRNPVDGRTLAGAERRIRAGESIATVSSDTGLKYSTLYGLARKGGWVKKGERRPGKKPGPKPGTGARGRSTAGRMQPMKLGRQPKAAAAPDNDDEDTQVTTTHAGGLKLPKPGEMRTCSECGEQTNARVATCEHCGEITG